MVTSKKTCNADTEMRTMRYVDELRQPCFGFLDPARQITLYLVGDLLEVLSASGAVSHTQQRKRPRSASNWEHASFAGQKHPLNA
jgi:hypothetical protein